LAIGVGVTTVLAARVSDTVTAARALVDHVASMLLILSRVAGASVTMVVRQIFDAIDAILHLFSLTVAVIFARPIMRLMNGPAEVLSIAAPFLQMPALLLLFEA